MKKSLVPFLALALSTAAAAADDSVNAAAQLKSLSAAFNRAAYDHNNNPALTDADRARAVTTLAGIARDCLELARRHPGEPEALDALTQVITHEYWLTNYSQHPGWGKDSPQAAAMAQILRDHIQSDQLATACKRAGFGFRQECENFLRTVLEKSPHRDVRGAACLRLAQSEMGLQLGLRSVERTRLAFPHPVGRDSVES